MKKIQKLLSICFMLILIATATVAGTLAYGNLTLSADEWASLHSENDLSISLTTYQRSYDENGTLIGLEDFKDNKILVPLVGSAQYDGTNFDKYGMPVADGYVDQIVLVKNTGTVDAYVRVLVAVPAELDDINEAGHQALHWNLGNRFMPNGSFSTTNHTNNAFKDISVDCISKSDIDEMSYNIYAFTYKNALSSGETTNAAPFVGFYLDRDVEIRDGHIYLDDVDTGFKNDNVKIYVKAQAVQTYGFDNKASHAFKTANLTDNPWETVQNIGTD